MATAERNLKSKITRAENKLAELQGRRDLVLDRDPVFEAALAQQIAEAERALQLLRTKRNARQTDED